MSRLAVHSAQQKHVFTSRYLDGDETAAEDLFKNLAVGGSPIAKPKYPGKTVTLPGGGFVGLRPNSKSGPPTIDIDIPEIPIKKIKFVP
jgi:hypothetical protein